MEGVNYLELDPEIPALGRRHLPRGMADCSQQPLGAHRPAGFAQRPLPVTKIVLSGCRCKFLHQGYHVAVSIAAVVKPVHAAPHEVNAQSAYGSFLQGEGSVDIGTGGGIEGFPVVFDGDTEFITAPEEVQVDSMFLPVAEGVRYDVDDVVGLMPLDSWALTAPERWPDA